MLDDRDRRALDRLIHDQEYRAFLEERQRRFWRFFRRVAFVVSALIGAALAVAQLAHLL